MIKVTLEFATQEEMVAYFTDRSEDTAPAGMSFSTNVTPVAAASKKGGKKKPAAASVDVGMPNTTVPHTAFPPAPAQPLSPIPAPPQGFPQPAGLQGQPAPVNYGQPMHQPAPQQPAPAPVQPAPVAPAPQAQQAWDRNAVLADLQARAAATGWTRQQIEGLFAQIFQENQMQQLPLGQLPDQDLYKFLLSFNQKVPSQSGAHLA